MAAAAQVYSRGFRIREFSDILASLPRQLDYPAVIRYGETVTINHLRQWVDRNGFTAGPIIAVYLRMICDYINNHPNRIAIAPPNAVPDIITMPPDWYNELSQPGGFISTAIRLSIERSITRDQFLRVQYFLVPLIPRAHASLVVISPVDKTVEILDSYWRATPNWPNRQDLIYTLIFHFLEYIFGPQFVPGEWRTMSTQSPQQEVNAPGCGYYVCRNAMRIACRDTLNPNSYPQNTAKIERFRIAAEVHYRSFTGRNDFTWPFDTYRINTHPGRANRVQKCPWQPLNQQLLTPARRTSAKAMRNKAGLTRYMRDMAQAGKGRWVKGHSAWARAPNTEVQFLNEIESRFDDIYNRRHAI